jgi:RNA polymerase sigma-54 factor
MSSQHLSQRQVQTLKLTPQQILYTKLLQLPILQFEQRVKEELEENPLLEEGASEDQPLDDTETALDLPQPEPLSIDEMPPAVPESDNKITDAPASELSPVEMPIDVEPPSAKEENDLNAEFDELWGEEDEVYKQQLESSDDERDYLQPVYEESLVEHLTEELRILGADEKELQIAEELIGNIDEDGYLRCEMDIILNGLQMISVSATEREVLDVLEKIWYLEPVGIGARTLQECLLIQLEVIAARDSDGDIETIARLAQRILRERYEEFTMKHYEKLVQTLAITPEELKRAIALIQKLNPKPGGAQGNRTSYVIPDFIVTRNGDELIATLNERSSPQIRVSKRYKTMLEDKKQTKETKEFLRNKLSMAKGFMGAIEMRKHTMRKVITSLVQRQYDFFISGPDKLRPMILKDIAEEVQMDIATISRVSNGKYVLCEHGVFELKYFFTAAIEMDSGDEISNRVLKQLIKDFIDKEENGKPLADEKIAEMLNDKGYKVARRTVAKYREQLNIPVARLRKKIETIA